jgi:saccharopine dehydrogenase (NAD+, L-lysine-forming)
VPEVPGELWDRTGDEQWYGLQWDMHDDFRRAGLTAIIGIGSDPGMVNVFCAYARQEIFDRIDYIDILDVNAGRHGFPFATNFNPEINLREVQAPAHFWKDGKWRELPALSRGTLYEFPEIGEQPVFIMDHDELHSLRRFFPEARQIRFWMGFGKEYRRHFDVLRNVGMLSHKPVVAETETGETAELVPLKVLKSLLPSPAELAPRYQGKTCIGNLIRGRVDGNRHHVFIYNILDHRDCFEEVGSQAVSYAAGIPPVLAAVLLLDGTWRRDGVYNPEQLPPQPFLESLPEFGMSWAVDETPAPLEA